MTFISAIASMIAATLALLPAVARAEQPTAAPYAPQQQVNIEADRLSVDSSLGVATFEGHVVVTRDGDRRQCSRLIVHYNQNLIDGFECEPPIILPR